MLLRLSTLGLILSLKQAVSAEISLLRGFSGEILKDDDKCHSKYDSAEKCDADADCTWCECSAIPSACYSLDAAANLPPGVFDCHKSHSIKSLTLNYDRLDIHNTKAGPADWLKCWSSEDESSCVGVTTTECSWCTLTNPIQGISAVCEPESFADSLVKGGICTKCESSIPAQMTFVSEKTKNVLTYESGLLTHSLEDNTVDPNFCDPKSPKSLSGYVSLDGSKYDGPGEDKHYFYWFFESRDTSLAEDIPLFIWLTGGPGCSSSLALLAENGPCSVNEDGSTTIPNEFSWNSNAHALWLDQPTGAGFSYGSVDDSSEEMVGENAYYFLQSFLQSHPEYSKNPFFVTGESYAGHYVPAITHRIWKGNKEKKEGTIHLNLQGMAIGNGLTNPEVQYPQYPEMAFHNSHGMQVIDEETYEKMKNSIEGCTYLIHECNAMQIKQPSYKENFYCQSAYRVCNSALTDPVTDTGVNLYDIRKKCEIPGLCYDFSNIKTFLNTESTKKALHVTHKGAKWDSCNDDIYAHFIASDWMKDMSQKVSDVLNDGIRVLVYAGDVDFICNYLGNRAWTLALDWKHSTEFNAAQDHQWNNKTGLAKSSNGFTFLQVYDAGHMVPMDQPEVSLRLINQFFAGDVF